MGKASSAKKVARVARAGGKKTTKQRGSLGFPAVITLVVVLGLLLAVYARVQNSGALSNKVQPRAQLPGEQSDHWHAAVGVSICGQFQPNPNDRAEDKEGIHTHGDGVIHIHPFGLHSAGNNAKLNRFLDDIGMKVTDTEIRMPNGKLYREGVTTCNGQPGYVKVAFWANALKATGTAPDKVYTSDFGNILLKPNYSAFTIAFVPNGALIGAPGTASKLLELGAADSGAAAPTSSTGSTVPATTPTTGSGK